MGLCKKFKSDLELQICQKLQLVLFFCSDKCLFVKRDGNSEPKFELLLSSAEKALVERAYQLRTELECAASDISGLFSKIGM